MKGFGGLDDHQFASLLERTLETGLAPLLRQSLVKSSKRCITIDIISDPN